MSLTREAVLIVNQALSGTEVAYVIPANVQIVRFRANGGALTLATTSGGATWTLADTESITLEVPGAGGETIYMDGIGTMEIMLHKGVVHLMR